MPVTVPPGPCSGTPTYDPMPIRSVIGSGALTGWCLASGTTSGRLAAQHPHAVGVLDGLARAADLGVQQRRVAGAGQHHLPPAAELGDPRDVGAEVGARRLQHAGDLVLGEPPGVRPVLLRAVSLHVDPLCLPAPVPLHRGRCERPVRER
ncbi:hypothetical protein GCM10025868_31720 [Angustibacter aerolatus]|uniref:Uncharacterized protein n=1 Tax=Angustibacter aerolatus TaxID=1162965 RepID=A0ABQ6JJI8_9ACTN|nr:hypothetical protein GCM10025868_31720 [Angustibacter aerolatus]